MTEKLDAAYAKLAELLEVHKEYPMTTLHQFIDNRNKVRNRNTIARVLSAIIPITNPDMNLIAAEDALDNMSAFYEVNLSLYKLLFFSSQLSRLICIRSLCNYSKIMYRP